MRSIWYHLKEKFKPKSEGDTKTLDELIDKYRNKEKIVYERRNEKRQNAKSKASAVREPDTASQNLSIMGVHLFGKKDKETPNKKESAHTESPKGKSPKVNRF
jgi:hypothetical protein